MLAFIVNGADVNPILATIIEPDTVKSPPTPAFPIIFVPDVALPMTVEPTPNPVLVLILTT